jgi:hypothetical protein
MTADIVDGGIGKGKGVEKNNKTIHQPLYRDDKV